MKSPQIPSISIAIASFTGLWLLFALGLRLLGTDPQWTYLLIGALIIAAVAIDQWIRKVAG